MFSNTHRHAAGLLIAALLGATPALAAPFVYIPTGAGGQIQVVDAASGQIVDTYTGLEAVHGLGVTPDGEFLIAGSYTERKPGESAPAKPAGMSEADHAKHHAPKPDATAADNDQVSTLSILRTSTGEVVRAVEVPGAVHHVAVSPDGRFAAVSQPGINAVSVIDLQSYAVVATVQTGILPNYLIFSPDSSLLYVSNAGDNTIAVISSMHWMVKRTVATGETPEHMVLSGDGKTMFVNNNDAGTVSAIDMASGETTATYKVGEGLHGIDLGEDGGAVLVAQRGGDRVARIDLASGQVSALDMGPEPYHLTSVTGTGLAFVSSADESVIRVINQADLSLVSTFSIGDTGHQMVVRQSR